MIFAIICIISFVVQNMCCKEYGRRVPDGMYSQLVMVAITTAIVTVVTALLGGVQAMPVEGFLIAIAFGAFFVLTLSTMTIAMNSGHMGVTLLIQNSSLIVPVIYGLIFWNDKMTITKGIGIACIFLMLVLSSGDTAAPTEAEKAKWNKKKWLIFTALAFLGDSLLAIFQGYMGRACATTSAATFTFWTSLFSMVIAAAAVFVLRIGGKREVLFTGKKAGLAFALCCLGIGLGTAGGNLFTIVALDKLKSSVLFFPLRSGALVLMMWIAGITIYRERITKRGIAMLLVGIAGLVLLNI
ncbi:MAG: hypothetical protein IJA26_07415, partial [Clostridia bacterium]|nr:hypothetical protein [Clostridia bacterium]